MMITRFDLIMWGLIAFGVLIQLILILPYIKFAKYRKVVALSFLVILICQSVVLYGGYIEPHRIEVVHEAIDISATEDIENLKIIVVGDYHLGPYKKDKFVEKSVNIINEQNPDLVLIPGDFVYSYQSQIDYFAPFQDVNSTYGIYAVLGNHDYGLSRTNKDDSSAPGAIAKSDYIAEKLTEFGVNVLRNEQARIDIDGKELVIVGLEDLWGSTTDYSSAFADLTEDDTVILLEHNPDIILDPLSDKADLIVSGHTHGGQIRLPLLGAVPPLPTQLGRSFDYGLFQLDTGNQLYITKGIGEMGPRARLFCRPEIVVIDLVF